ncbi:MAG: response regulator, partial [Verrucomicrobiales bacterium]|nr:response regulator [Verrucomicrobiales bacterium]
SKFSLIFPRVEISARIPESSLRQESDVDFDDLRPATILVVDDNPVNIALVTGYFEGTHHTLHSASNGREALDWLSEHRTDVVLMDIRMPVMDGRTALDELRTMKECALLPVIAVTASSMARDEAELRRAFDGYVRKPFSRARLFEELSHFLHRVESQSSAASTTFDLTDKAPKPEWILLARRLREIEVSDWPAVRDGMVSGEVAAFAANLRSLAESSECMPLEQFADRIRSQAETFSLDELEKSLESFPVLVKYIEERGVAIEQTSPL